MQWLQLLFLPNMPEEFSYMLEISASLSEVSILCQNRGNDLIWGSIREVLWGERFRVTRYFMGQSDKKYTTPSMRNRVNETVLLDLNYSWVPENFFC